MVSVLCVKFGNTYGRKYVKKLRNMVARHLVIPHEFVCLTDDPKPFAGIRSIVQPNGNYKKGWWHKIHMFDPSLPLGDTILYFDLDIIIHNNIDKLINVNTDKITGIRDFNRKFNPNWNSLNSSVMCWQHQRHPELFTEFNKNKTLAQRYPGDQDWIWHKAKNKVTFYPDEWLQSYKWEVRERSELIGMSDQRTFRQVNNNVDIPDECCVTVFHGHPKPEHIYDKFVIDNWR